MVSLADIGSTVMEVVGSTWVVELDNVAPLWVVKLDVIASLSGSAVVASLGMAELLPSAFELGVTGRAIVVIMLSSEVLSLVRVL